MSNVTLLQGSFSCVQMLHVCNSKMLKMFMTPYRTFLKRCRFLFIFVFLFFRVFLRGIGNACVTLSLIISCLFFSHQLE